MKARITAIGRQAITSFELDDATLIVGRDRSCDQIIQDASLERRHIALSQTQGSVQITDLQSRSGTFVNGRRIERSTLGDGDRIRLGETVLIVSTTQDVENDPIGRRELLIADDERFFIRIAKEWGLLDRSRMRSILWAKSQDHILGDARRVEEICAAQGFLTVVQVHEILGTWEHLVIVCRSCSSVYTPGDLRRSRRLLCPACHQPLKGPLDIPVPRPVETTRAALDRDLVGELNKADEFAGCIIERRLFEDEGSVRYLATQKSTRRRVTIKIYKRFWESGDQAHHFVEEARKVADLVHPHIIPVLNVGFERDCYFIVSQYFEGKSLEEQIEAQGPLAPERARYVAAAAASALHEAHRHQIFHGDVRPRNIRVGRNRVVKLSDFGILSQASMKPGIRPFRSPDAWLHMAPELEVGDPIDARTDVYSLGLTLRAMLLGKFPPEDHRYVELPSPEEEDPRVPKALSDIVVNMLQKNKEERYQTMRDLIQALRIANPYPATVHALASPEEPRKSVKTSKARTRILRTLQVAGLLVLIVTAGFIGTLISMKPGERRALFETTLKTFGSFGGGVAQAESPADGTGRIQSLLEATPNLVLPQKLRQSLQQAFAQRDFSRVYNLLGNDRGDTDPELMEYRRKLRETFLPFTRYTRVPSGGDVESYMRDNPVTFEEYDDFIRPPECRDYIDRVRPGWWNEKHWTNRLRDLKYFRDDNAPFIFASYYEAEAYCLWLTDHWQKEGLNFQYRLPTQADFADRLPEKNAWVQDPSEIEDKRYVCTKTGFAQLVDYDAITHQPTIRPVVDIPVEAMKQLESALLGTP